MSRLARLSGGLDWSVARISLLKTLVCCGVMVGVVLGLQQIHWPGDSFKVRLAILGAQCLAGGAAYLAMAWLVKLDEPWMLMRKQSPGVAAPGLSPDFDSNSAT